jgi:hypothetical protein
MGGNTNVEDLKLKQVTACGFPEIAWRSIFIFLCGDVYANKHFNKFPFYMQIVS